MTAVQDSLVDAPRVNAQPFDFGRYEVLHEIGRGAMGVVYRARERELDRIVALKMILSHRLKATSATDRFIAEARIAAQAKHAGVVHVYDAGEHQGQRFIAMELLEGPSLDAVLAQRRLSFDEAASILAKIARAAHHLHELGIVHRDLKPSNVMLAAPDARPCLTDFGLAKVQGNGVDSSQLTIAGTPGYMSPEQLGIAAEEVGPASDIYALGAVLFEAVTGARPFGNESTQDVLMRSLQGRFDRPRALDSRVPRALEAIILKAMEQRPARRYSTAAELADDLDRFVARLPVEAAGGGLCSKLQDFARRRVALVVRLCAFALFFGVALVNHALGYVDGAFVLQLGATLVAWSALSWSLNQVAHRSAVWQRLWCAVDVLLLTHVVWLLDGVNSSLVSIYPVLIVTAGLWSNLRLVWFTTLATFAGYGALILESELGRTDLARPADAHIVFAVVLIGTAALTTLYVRRFEALRRLYARS